MKTLKKSIERRLEKSGRITPREVLEAYRQTGLLPSDRGWWREAEGKPSACAVGAMMVASGDVNLKDLRPDPHDDIDPTALWSPECDELINDFFERRGFGRPEVAGSYQFEFTQGFDGRQLFSADVLGLQGALARRDGARCRRFVFGKQAPA